MMTAPKPLPRPYDVGADIARLSRVRPIGQAVQMALQRSKSAEGNPEDPLSSRFPNLLRRLTVKAPKVDNGIPALRPMRPPRP